MLKLIYSFFKYLLLGIWYIISFFPKYLFLGILVIFKKKDKFKYSKMNSFISVIFFILSISVYLFCVFFITRRFVQNERIRVMSNWVTNDTEILISDESNNLDDGSSLEPNVDVSSNNSNSSFFNTDIESQLSINSDTVGWIVVNGTNISYPVVQTTDNSFYLSHDFYKNNYYNGWVFGDYRDNFNSFGRNTIIYAHNSVDGKMFSNLTKLLKKDWFDNKDNKYIKLSTLNANTIWEIFSVYTIEPEIYYLTTGFTDETFVTFINTIANRTIIDFDAELDISDKILTLQTCTNSGNKRIVFHAKLIALDEK